MTYECNTHCNSSKHSLSTSHMITTMPQIYVLFEGEWQTHIPPTLSPEYDLNIYSKHRLHNCPWDTCSHHRKSTNRQACSSPLSFLHLPFVSQTKAQQVARSTKTPALIILYGCSPLPSLPLQPTFSRPWLWQALIAVWEWCSLESRWLLTSTLLGCLREGWRLSWSHLTSGPTTHKWGIPFRPSRAWPPV